MRKRPGMAATVSGCPGGRAAWRDYSRLPRLEANRPPLPSCGTSPAIRIWVAPAAGSGISLMAGTAARSAGAVHAAGGPLARGGSWTGRCSGG
jgi:hypothetical protein